MSYRPGKRVGAASWAHRAGSGDIIGWYAPTAGDASPGGSRASTEQPPPPQPTAVIVTPRRQAEASVSVQTAQQQPGIESQPFPVSPMAQPPSRPLTRDGSSARIFTEVASPRPVASEDRPIVQQRASSFSVMASPRLSDDDRRPGTASYGSQYSLRASYEAIHDLPVASDIGSLNPYPAAFPSRSTTEVIKSAMDGRDDFLAVLLGRRAEIKIIRHIWSKQGACAALAHVGRLRNLSIAVDILQAVAGVGFPKWPSFADLDWLVELTPVLISLLNSDYEDYIVVGLSAVGSLLPCIQPLLKRDSTPADRSATLPSQFDVLVVAVYCAQSLTAALTELSEFDGRLGKTAKARLVGVSAFLEQASQAIY